MTKRRPRPLADRLALAVLLAAGAMLTGAFAPAVTAPASHASDSRAVARVIERLTADSLLADRLVNHGQRDSAHVRLASLIAEARATGDPATIARALLLDAAQDCRVGLGAAAMPYVIEGRKFAEASRDTGVILWSLRVEWMARGYTGPPAEVERITRLTQVLAERNGNPEYRGWAPAMAGYVAFRQGDDVAGARRDMEDALRRFEQLRHGPGILFCENMIGNMIAATGDYAGARPHYQRLGELAAQLDRPQMKAYAIGNLGMIETRIGDPARAVELNREALAIQLQRGGFSDALILMDNLVVDLAALGRMSEARQMAEQALAEAQRHEIVSEVPWQQQTLAEVLAKDGRPAAAKAMWRATLAHGDSADVAPRVLAAIGLADLLAGEDSLAAALALIGDTHRRLAAHAESQPRSQLLTAEAKLLIAAGRYDEAKAVVAPVAEHLEAGGDLELALAAWIQVVRAERRIGHGEAAERAIARALAVWERGRRAPSDPEFRELRGEQARVLTVECVEQALTVPSSMPSADRLAAAFVQLQQFTTRTLLERMAGPRAFGASSSLGPGVPAIELARFQRDVLRPDELFLEFVSGPDTTLLFAVTRTACRVEGLPGERTLAPALELGRSVLASRESNPDPSIAAKTLAELGSLLLGVVADDVRRARRITIAPDGPLHHVPFAALIAPGEREPLLVAHAVGVVPSAAFLATIRSRPVPRGSGVLAVAGVPRAGEHAIAGAEREVRDLSGRYREIVVRRGDEARQALLDSAETDRGFHFAGHTEVDDQLPWRSGLRLANTGDSMLTASAIASHRIGSPLVVLSSCESGGGRARSGEGVAGLATAFLVAGSPTVVATLWPVDDRVTARLIERFYDELARGDPVTDALRKAQDAIRRTRGTEHPFYWAGFVLIGEGETLLALTRRGPAISGLAAWALVEGAIGLVFLAIVMIFRRRRRASPNAAPDVV